MEMFQLVVGIDAVKRTMQEGGEVEEPLHPIVYDYRALPLRGTSEHNLVPTGSRREDVPAADQARPAA